MSRELELLNPSAERHPDLKPDCERCCGLCCVAPAFAVSPEFAIDKGPGEPCPNLTKDFRCGIHDRLRVEGFRGCVAYDCFGAGQKVTQVTFNGRHWRGSPGTAAQKLEGVGGRPPPYTPRMYLSTAAALPP